MASFRSFHQFLIVQFSACCNQRLITLTSDGSVLEFHGVALKTAPFGQILRTLNYF